MKNRHSYDNVAVIILAAGLGTRMKSDRAKVLHEINGIPMIRFVVETASRLGVGEIIVVIGHQAEQVRAVVSDHPRLRFARQDRQLGTGHAVMSAFPKVSEKIEHVVVLCGDVPLLKAKTISRLVDDHFISGRDLTLLAVEVPDPTGYGRIVMETGRRVTGIIEEADASETEKAIRIVNAGIYCVRRGFLRHALDRIRTDNAQGEYYLTDIVGIAHDQERPIGVVFGDDPVEVAGVNDRSDLKVVRRAMKTAPLKIS